MVLGSMMLQSMLQSYPRHEGNDNSSRVFLGLIAPRRGTEVSGQAWEQIS